jgi:predicted  nucleic acid-binding Zn-ribbon protein
MPPEEKHKINCWISESLWKQVEHLGYDSPTKATVAAFEALVLQEEKRSDQETLGSTQEERLPEMEKQLEEAQRQIKASEEKLKIAPDPAELAQLRSRSEELDKHNSTLKEELRKSGQREEDLKQMHNNYFLQVQTLINQKAIEAPRAKKPWWQFW